MIFERTIEEKKLLLRDEGMTQTELKANLGLVLRGDILDLRTITEGIDLLLRSNPSVQIVFRHVSASKLWIKEGDGMNDRDNA